MKKICSDHEKIKEGDKIQVHLTCIIVTYDSKSLQILD